MRLQRSLGLALACAVAAAGAASARAAEDDAERLTRPHVWHLELRASTVYYPDVDNGLKPVTSYVPGPVVSAPFMAVFGPRHRLLVEAEGDRDVWQGFGSLGVGVALAYAEFYGTGFHDTSSGSTPFYVGSGDGTGFHIAQARLLAIYRFDYLVPRKVPLVPFVRGGFDWFYYWNQLSSGTVTPDLSGSGDAQGLVTGVEATLGLSLLLDVIDPVISREMFRDTGIAHTYLTAGYTWQDIENGPSNFFHQLFVNTRTPATLNLSSRFFDFGVAIEF